MALASAVSSSVLVRRLYLHVFYICSNESICRITSSVLLSVLSFSCYEFHITKLPAVAVPSRMLGFPQLEHL